jgi:omega-amidase
MTLTGFSMNAQAIAEEFNRSDSIHQFKKIAQVSRIRIVFGMVLHGNKKPQNSLIFINHLGRVAARYTKLHSFSYADEHLHYEQGSEIVISTIRGHKIGFTICYDLRFPELFSILGKQCSTIMNIANWPAERIDHWYTLLQARAIENQVFVIGVNRTGTDGNMIKYRKSSMVVSPQGEIISPDTADGNTDIYSIDYSKVKSYRDHFPVLKDRRVHFYSRHL